MDESLGYAPNHIITKRVGKDLHVSFEVEGKGSDLIINGFFEDANQALIGMAEDGSYYYYIPDTGEVVDYVTQLEVGDIEGQALGGESMIEPLWIQMASTGLPWWATGIGGLLAVGVIGAAASSGDGGGKTEQPIDAIDDGSANNPYISVAEDTPLTNLNVLSNDSSPEGRPLSIVTASSPNGEVTVNPDGTLNFIPAAHFNGPTTITYTISDGAGGSDTATVHVDVTDVNDAPEAESQRIVTDENTVIETPLTGSDVDGDVVSITVIQVPPASQGFLSYEKNGTRVEITANAVLTPEEAESVTFTATENFNGIVNPIKFSTTDDDGAVSTPATVEITVSDINDAPEAVDAIVSTREGTPVSVPLIATDIDGTVESITITNIPDAAGEGVLTYTDTGGNEQTITANTVLSADEASTVVFTPVANFNGEATSVTFIATDDDGLDSAPATVTLDVTDVNTPPTADDAAISTDEDTAVSVPFTGSDVDGDIVSVTVLQVPPANQGVLSYTRDDNQVVEVTPNTVLSSTEMTTVKFTPAPDFHGSVSDIQFSTTDDDGAVSTPATVEISVVPVIDITHVVIKGDSTVVEGENAEYSIQFLNDNGIPVVVTQDTQVTVTFNNGTTQDADTEYSDGQTITVTIPAGSSSAPFDVQAIDDYLSDDGEGYNLTITDVDTDAFEAVDINGFTDSNNVVHSNTVATTINDDTVAAAEDTVYVRLTNNASVVEGDGNALEHTLELVDSNGDLVTLTGSQEVVVNLKYLNDDTNAADYTNTRQTTFTFDANSGSSINLTNDAVNDNLIEGRESYLLKASIASSQGFERVRLDAENSVIGEIIDDISPKPDTNRVQEDGITVATSNVLSNDEVGTGTTVSLTTTPADANDYGSLVLNDDGSYTFTLNNSLPAVQALAKGETKELVYEYTLAGNAAPTTLTIAIEGANDAPTLDLSNSNTTTTSFITAFEEGGGPIAIADSSAIVDIDTNDTINSAVIKITNAQLGDVLSAGTLPAGITATLVGSGRIELSGSASQADYQTAIDAITFNNTSATPSEIDRLIEVVVIDNNGLSSNIATTVVEVDATPQAVNDATQVEEGGVTISSTTENLNLLTNDDLGTPGTAIIGFSYKDENGDLQSGSFDTSTTQTVDTLYGSLTIGADGSWSYTSDAAEDHSVQLIDTIEYTIRDGNGDESSAEFNITVSDTTPTALIPEVTVSESDLPNGTNEIKTH